MFVMEKVAQNGLALQHASTELQANREVVIAAAVQNWDALQYASTELQADLKLSRQLKSALHRGCAKGVRAAVSSASGTFDATDEQGRPYREIIATHPNAPAEVLR